MALHRDIYWVGKQWAVTGYGVQACDQKQKGKFDIEASRLWEDGVLESMRARKWLNIEDFESAIGVARKHYPEPPRKAAPAVVAPPSKVDSAAAKPAPKQIPAPVPASFVMHLKDCRAKFLPTWRVRVHWNR